MSTKLQRMIDKTVQVPLGTFMKRMLLSAAMVTAIGLTGLAAGAEGADDSQGADDSFREDNSRGVDDSFREDNSSLEAVVPAGSITFKMVPSEGAASCLSSDARAHVTVSNVAVGQNLHVEVENLPPN